MPVPTIRRTPGVLRDLRIFFLFHRTNEVVSQFFSVGQSLGRRISTVARSMRARNSLHTLTKRIFRTFSRWLATLSISGFIFRLIPSKILLLLFSFHFRIIRILFFSLREFGAIETAFQKLNRSRGDWLLFAKFAITSLSSRLISDN